MHDEHSTGVRLDFASRVTLSPEVMAQEIDGESVLLDLNSESYFGLDQIGTRIWELANQYSELQKIFEVMLSEFEVDEDRLRHDLGEFVAELADAGLLSVESRSPTQRNA